MENVTIKAEARSKGTKSTIHSLRRQGMIPAVLYGKDIDNLSLQLPEKELNTLLTRHSIGGTLFNLDVNDNGHEKSYLVMIREVQRDPIKRKLLHADFLNISMNKELETEIPVHLVGEAPGVKAGGILQHMLRDVTVACLPSHLPEYLEADISGLEIGGQLTVAELKLPEGVRAVSPPESIIALVVAPTAVKEEEETEAGAETEGAEAAPAEETEE